MGALITLNSTEFTLLLQQEKISEEIICFSSKKTGFQSLQNLFYLGYRWGMQHPHKLNSPSTLVFCRKVYLKVIIVVMDIKKTTSFVKLGNAVKFTLGKYYFGYNY